jgi:hypothetical protein
VSTALYYNGFPGHYTLNGDARRSCESGEKKAAGIRKISGNFRHRYKAWEEKHEEGEGNESYERRVPRFAPWGVPKLLGGLHCVQALKLPFVAVGFSKYCSLVCQAVEVSGVAAKWPFDCD